MILDTPVFKQASVGSANSPLLTSYIRIGNGNLTVAGRPVKGDDACGRTFVLQPKGPRYDGRCKDQAVAASQDRLSQRGVTRTFGVCRQTIGRWVGKKAESLPAFQDTLLPAEENDVLELDELWSLVGRKAQPLWLWVALCRRARQIVAWNLGERSQQGACDLHTTLPKSYQHCYTRSDYWEAYGATFPTPTHRFCGKREGGTNHVERWFGTLRARVGHLVPGWVSQCWVNLRIMRDAIIPSAPMTMGLPMALTNQGCCATVCCITSGCWVRA